MSIDVNCFFVCRALESLANGESILRLNAMYQYLPIEFYQQFLKTLITVLRWPQRPKNTATDGHFRMLSNSRRDTFGLGTHENLADTSQITPTSAMFLPCRWTRCWCLAIQREAFADSCGHPGWLDCKAASHQSSSGTLLSRARQQLIEESPIRDACKKSPTFRKTVTKSGMWIRLSFLTWLDLKTDYSSGYITECNWLNSYILRHFREVKSRPIWQTNKEPHFLALGAPMPYAKSTSRPRLCIHKNQSVIALFNEIQASDSPVLRLKSLFGDFAISLRWTKK